MNILEPFEVSLSGVNLIEASAGTGKTYNITSLYIRNLIEKEVGVEQILVMTFTKAATKELKDRLLKRLRESIVALKKQAGGDDDFLNNLVRHVQHPDKAAHKLQQAVHNFDKAAVYTIHGFCQQILQQYAFESGSSYGREVLNDDRELVQELVDDYWRKWVAEASGNPIKTPLLKLITDNYATPDKLFDKVGNTDHLGYKRIQPEQVEINELDKKLKRFRSYFADLKKLWQAERDQLLSLLSRKEMKNYRSNWLAGWFDKMDQLFIRDVAPIELFDKFERFTQERIDNGLKKKYQKKGTQAPQHHFFKIADKYLALAKKLQNYKIQFKLDLIAYLQKQLPIKKEKLGVISYSDQLTLVRKALKRDDSKLGNILRANYPIALVDEYQDTDPIQYDILTSIYKGPEDDFALFMIGDPKQSIYRFRGAEIFSYLKTRKQIPDNKVFSLDKNYRSTPDFVKALNTFWQTAETPFVNDQIHFSPVKAGKDKNKEEQLTEAGRDVPPVQFQKLSSGQAEEQNKGAAKDGSAENTADEIKRLLAGGRDGTIKIGEEDVSGEDIAVLVSTHRQADLVREKLQERGIKSVQYGHNSVFKSEEAGQLIYVLEAVISPSNERLIKAAMATPIMGYQPDTLIKIEENTRQWIEILDRFAEWHRLWQEKGFSAMFGRLMQEERVGEQLTGLINGERRLTNVLHLAELLQFEARERDGMRALVKWMRQKKADNKNSSDEELLRLESDDDLVQILTIHSSKGLEFPIVFYPFLWDGPHISDKGQALEYHQEDEAIVDLSGKSDEERNRKRKWAREEELAENMRLAYVAMTRAKYCCYLTWCYARSCAFSPLGYLLYGKGKSIDVLVGKIDKNAKKLGNEIAEKRIDELCKNHPALFSCEEVEQGGQQKLDLLQPAKVEVQPARTFNRSTPLPAGEAVSSFSSLTRRRGSNPDQPDYDQPLFDVAGSRDLKEPTEDMFGFPKGAGPGTYLHKIFEEITFDDPQTFKPIVGHNLSLYGMNDKWVPVVTAMLHITVNKKLLKNGDGLKLSALQPGQLINEMEFYYKSSSLKTGELYSIIRDDKIQANGPLNKTAKGFLKGFIDLTFEYNGKYYLLDYKSNYLGDCLEDYRQDILQDEMIEASYDLQYYIYAIALHRFLKKKLTGYNYSNHFGGVFYLFLRGINEENSAGIFYDCPNIKTIQTLDDYLLEGEIQ